MENKGLAANIRIVALARTLLTASVTGIGCGLSKTGISPFTGVSGKSTRASAAYFAGNARSGGLIPAYI